MYSIINLVNLVKEINLFLKIQNIIDYCPNGLQIEGCSNVKRIVTGVTANKALFLQAVKKDANMIIVHHGFFGKNEHPCITGIKKERIKILLSNNISLLAYHLPLDQHLEIGNNVQLAKKLELIIEGQFYNNIESPNNYSIGLIAKLDPPLSPDNFSYKIHTILERKPLLIKGSKIINSIALCTGSASSYLYQAINCNVDAYLTGDISENSVHVARENNITLIAAGHHATERYGIKALGEYIEKSFNIEHIFIDIPNPI